MTGSAIKYGTANPSVSIVSYNGPAEIKTKIESVIKRSDWFEVLPAEKGNSAKVRLQIQVVQNDGGTTINANGQLGTQTFQVAGSDSKSDMAVLKFVDALLKQVFNVPALCTRKLVFAVQGKNSKKELFSCYIDGSEYKRLTNNNAICTEPSWGNVNALVYTLLTNNSIKVVLVDMKQQRQRIVSNFRGLNSSPALSADGRFLALPLSIEKQVDLYVIDLSNGKKTRLTNDKNVESSPCWSPDGSTICYVSDVIGKPQLYLISAQGGKSRRLQLGGNECVSPDWSAKSNKLCYATRSNSGQYIISVIDMANPSGTPETITRAAGNWEAPSWAPDGRHIACTRTSGRGRDLYMIDSTLKSFSQITKGVDISLPTWQPAH